jgi:hypothetical protein
MVDVSGRLNADLKTEKSDETEMDLFGEQDFKERVANAIQKARTVLTLGTNPELPEDVPHAYGNKYELAEALGSLSLAALVNVLEVLGLNGKTLRVLREWADERAVTLRLKAEERCKFDRETKREQESDTKYVRKYSGVFGGGGGSKTTDKVVTTITEWFWRFEVEYKVYAFAGASEQEGKVVVLQGRRGKYEIMTTSKDAPRPKVTIKDAVDVNISPLLRQLDAKGTQVRFGINREAKERAVDRKLECG